MNATAQKWLWATLIAGIVLYYAWKYATTKTGAVNVGTGNPAAGPGGLTLAENPSSNAFRDLFSAVGLPAAQAPAAASSSNTPAPAPPKTGTPRITPTTTDTRPSALALLRR